MVYSDNYMSSSLPNNCGKALLVAGFLGSGVAGCIVVGFSALFTAMILSFLTAMCSSFGSPFAEVILSGNTFGFLFPRLITMSRQLTLTMSLSASL
ncbi:hypothetical protein HanRHA438_Chr01g0009671 [Helianthus annuus]|nr:hypothetical protein HanRHA438_Chr01g0009671 [Helianthus annuus]